MRRTQTTEIYEHSIFRQKQDFREFHQFRARRARIITQIQLLMLSRKRMRAQCILCEPTPRPCGVERNPLTHLPSPSHSEAFSPESGPPGPTESRRHQKRGKVQERPEGPQNPTRSIETAKPAETTQESRPKGVRFAPPSFRCATPGR